MAQRRSGGNSESSSSRSSGAEKPSTRKTGSRSSSSKSSSSKASSQESASSKSNRSETTRGTAPSAADIDNLERFEASEEAKRTEPSKVDAMGQDKRREVVGHSYGPSKKSQIMFFVAVGAVLVVIIGGWLALVAAFDKPPTHFKDTAPWSKTLTDPQLAAQQDATPVAPSSPCGEPGNQYPIPAESPCAPPSKANGKQGASSGDPSNVAGVSKGQ